MASRKGILLVLVCFVWGAFAATIGWGQTPSGNAKKYHAVLVRRPSPGYLFDRFYKTDTSRQGGSGLGLAIARQHAERLGGTLTVRSTEPHGLTFELRLPVTESLHGSDTADTPTTDAEAMETSRKRSEQ